MNNPNLIKINGHFYLRVEQEVATELNKSNQTIIFDEGSLILEPAINESSKYWDIAAKEFKREIFMNTVRPLLKEKLGFNYTEIQCEEKAKLLCQKYYEYQQKGEKYTGPFLL